MTYLLEINWAGFSNSRINHVTSTVRTVKQRLELSGDTNVTVSGPLLLVSDTSLRVSNKSDGSDTDLSVHVGRTTLTLRSTPFDVSLDPNQMTTQSQNIVHISTRKRRLVVTNSRFGTLPIYWTKTGSSYLFSSLQALAALCREGAPKICNLAAIRYLASHYHGAWGHSESMFQDVYRIPGATRLTIANATVQQQRYWSPRPEGGEGDLDSFSAEYLNLLAVDDTINNFGQGAVLALSGGLDSGTIAAAVVASRGSRIPTISMMNGNRQLYDESELISESQKAFSSQALVVTPDAVAMSRELVSRLKKYDQPLATVSMLGYEILLTSAAEHGFSRIYTGSGGDALFGGTYPFYLYFLADLYLTGSREEFDWELERWIALHGTPEYPKSKQTFYDFLQAKIDIAPNRMGLCAHLDLVLPHSYVAAEHRHRVQRCLVPGLVQDGTLLTTYATIEYLYHGIAPGVDSEYLMSVRTGVDLVSPFLGAKFVDFGYRLPNRYKIANGLNKHLVRNAMRDRIPSRVLSATYKQGFNLPFGDWLREPSFRQLFIETCRQAEVEPDFLVSGSVDSLLDLHMRGDASYAMALWQVLNFSVWRLAWF